MMLFRFRPLCRLSLLAAAFSLVSLTLSATTVRKIPGLSTNGKDILYADTLFDMLSKTLYKDGNPLYQDLEMVFNTCYGSGYIDYFQFKGGFKGAWSASAAVEANRAARWDRNLNNKPMEGLASKWKSEGIPLKVLSSDLKTLKDGYANGYSEQYLKLAIADPTLTVKQLHDQATANNPFPDKGSFASGGGSESYTLLGNADTKSRHAIVQHGGDVNATRQALVEKLESTLRSDAFKYDSVQTLFHDPFKQYNPPAGVDRTKWKDATQADLQNALDDLRTELLKNPGKEKAALFFEGHSAINAKRTYKTKANDPPVPGEGFTFHNGDASISIPLDPYEQDLYREVPGQHRNSNMLERITNPILNLTTYAESVSGPVEIYVGGMLLAQFSMNNSRGRYEFTIPDSILGSLSWTPGADFNLPLSFHFASDSDWFQISTEYDQLDPQFAAELNGYGLETYANLAQGASVPEPSTCLTLAAGLGSLTIARRRRRLRE